MALSKELHPPVVVEILGEVMFKSAWLCLTLVLIENINTCLGTHGISHLKGSELYDTVKYIQYDPY